MELSLTGKEKINDLVKKTFNIGLAVYAVIILFDVSFLGFTYGNISKRLLSLVTIVFAILYLCRFILLTKKDKLAHLKSMLPIIIYFAIRMATFLFNGCEYSTARAVAFEGVYLIFLSGIILEEAYIKNIFIKIFVWAVFAINLANLIIYLYGIHYVSPDTGLVEVKFISEYTAYRMRGFLYSTMYSNPNHMGMITGIAMLLCFIIIKNNKNKRNITLYGINIVISGITVLISKCASAWMGLLCVFIVIAMVRIFGDKWKKRLTILALIGSVVVCTLMYGFVRFTVNEGSYSNVETKIDTLTTARYGLWKDMAYAHADKLLLGEGSITREKQTRYRYNLDKGIDEGLDPNSSLTEYLGPHNGYYAVFYCAGLLGFIAFVYILFSKIRRSKLIEEDYWYAIVIYILVINLVESMFITSINIPCLFLFIILNMEKKDELEEKPELKELTA